MVALEKCNQSCSLVLQSTASEQWINLICSFPSPTNNEIAAVVCISAMNCFQERMEWSIRFK
uniref:Uncharacterized protein n=1 Tax=Rhizophora mucronata TaxID=61149 RepID=A0A2P2Q6V0_RHIMU